MTLFGPRKPEQGQLRKPSGHLLGAFEIEGWIEGAKRGMDIVALEGLS